MLRGKPPAQRLPKGRDEEYLDALVARPTGDAVGVLDGSRNVGIDPCFMVLATIGNFFSCEAEPFRAECHIWQKLPIGEFETARVSLAGYMVLKILHDARMRQGNMEEAKKQLEP